MAGTTRLRDVVDTDEPTLVNGYNAVEHTAASVVVPAGRFDECLLVSGHGTTTADVGNYLGRTEIKVSTEDWFAPGVGLVKSIRTELTSSDALNFGRLSMELRAL